MWAARSIGSLGLGKLIAVDVIECCPYVSGSYIHASDGDNACIGSNKDSGPMFEDCVENACCAVEVSWSTSDVGSTATAVSALFPWVDWRVVWETPVDGEPSEAPADILAEPRV